MGYRTQKPRLGRRLDLSHDLARGLIVAAPFNEGAGSPVNSVNARRSVPTGSLAWGSTQLGTARVNKTSASAAGDTFSITPYNVRGPITVEVACVIYAFPTSSLTTLWELGSQADSLYIDNSSGYTFIDFRLGGVDCYGGGTSTNLVIGQPCVIHGTYDNATIRCYKNGVFLYSQAATPSQMGTQISSTLSSFGGPGGYYPAIASLDRGFVWTRPLSQDEIEERVADPWGIYRRPWRPKYFVSSGVTLVTASDSASLVDSGTLTYSPVGTDSLSLSDLGILAYSPTATDAISLSDIGILGYSPLATDAISLSDIGILGYSPLASDSITLADSGSIAAAIATSDQSTLADSSIALGTPVSGYDTAFCIDTAELAVRLDLRQAIYAACAANARIVGIVGNAIRPGVQYEADQYPALTYQVKSNRKTHTLSGTTNQRLATVEFTARALTVAQCVLTLEALDDMFEGLSTPIGGLNVMSACTDDQADRHATIEDASDRTIYLIQCTYLIHYQLI